MKNINRYIVNFGVLVAVAGLAFLAYQGFYNRNWSDDWCYDRDFKFLGIFKTIGLYFVTGRDAIRGWPLDRYGMTLLSGIVAIPGVFGTQIFTAITIVLWLAAIYWLSSNFAKLNGVDVSQNILLLFSSFILYFTLYISPDRFQILYWRSGIIPYTYALITGVTLLGLITTQALNEKKSRALVYAVMILCLIGGGLSEIGAAFLLGGTTLLLVVAWWFKRAGKEWAARSFSLMQIAWVSLLAAFIILVVAPSNLTRYTTMQDGPNNFLLVPLLSIQSALFFITHSITDLPLPHLMMFMIFISASILAHTEMKYQMDIKQSAWLVGVTIIVSFLLITAIQAPTTYLYSAPPDPRGQSLSRFVMTIGLALISWAAGAVAARHIPAKLILVPMLFLLLGYGYTARAINTTTKDLPGFMQRAQVWDERDALMRAAESQGIKRMEVVVIDTHDIGTKDVMRSQDMNKWVKSCAAGYYGMDAIKAKGTK